VIARGALSLLAALLIAPATAAAQSTTSDLLAFGGTPDGTAISTTVMPANATGELTVSFHGDPASGCAAMGVCGYSGTVIVRPGGAASLGFTKYRHNRQIGYVGSLSLGVGISANQEEVTFARVTRSESGGSGGVCTDLGQQEPGVALTVRDGIVTLPLFEPGGTLLATRCAGPLDGDLAGSGPQVSLPLAKFLDGEIDLPMSGSWTFASHGFAGTVSSTMTLALGRPHVQKVTTTNVSGPGIKTERFRIVNEQLSLVRSAGSIRAAVRGSSVATECALLDSCGLTGNLVLTPAPIGATGDLEAIAPAKRPYRDLLAALGLNRRGNPHGIQVTGIASWMNGGTMTSYLAQSGRCVDSAPLGAGLLVFGRQGKRVKADYAPAGDGRTRCPGPLMSQNQVQALAESSMPLAVLGRHTFTFDLVGNQRFSDDGYEARTGGRLNLTLRRGRISKQLITAPTGFLAGFSGLFF
jgi:hypothetical protein